MRAEEAKTFTVEDFRRHVAALKPETRMMIDGDLIDSSSGKHFETVNSASGEVIAALPLDTDDDVDPAVASAQPWGGFRQSGTSRDKRHETLLTPSQTESVWMHLG